MRLGINNGKSTNFMCGIFGYISESPLNDQGIINALSNRGPDDNGIYVLTDNSNPIGKLIHTRLSIIDLSKRASQPMSDNSGRFTITYNGEIYNFKEIKRDLEGKGHHFRTTSDTEVLLLGYKEWGINVLEKLQGMFSFAIWDQYNKILFLARDHFGMKPLYYHHSNKGFCFGSTIKSIFKSGMLDKFTLDKNSISAYWKTGAFVPPDTIVTEIKCLLPGQYIILTNNKIEIHQYFSAEEQRKSENIDFQATQRNLRNLLIETVEKHLISDAPLGIFLSGGIDSSLIAAIASKVLKKPTHTFTVGFNDSKHWNDETVVAEKTARFIGSQHENVILDKMVFQNNFDEFLDAIDVPSIDGLNSFLISKAVKTKVKVILSGLGGDEMFAGYPVFHEAFSLQKITFLDRIIQYLPTGILFRLKKSHLQNLGKTLYEILLSKRCLQGVDDNCRKLLYHYFFEDEEPLKTITLFEIKNYMANMLLRDADAVSMHNSLEVRTPFVDKNILNFVLSIQDSYKISKKHNKSLLVNSFSDLLIKETYTNKKTGFVLPVNDWIAKSETEIIKNRLTEYESLLDSNNLLFFNSQKINSAKNGKEFYLWLVFFKWIENNSCYLKI